MWRKWLALSFALLRRRRNTSATRPNKNFLQSSMNARQLEIDDVMKQHIIVLFGSAIKVLRCDFDF